MRPLLATLLAFLLLAAPAAALDHRMTVNEVATSLAGSTANQFVELLDPADEPFPFPTGYRLAVYDSAGVSVGNQSLGSGMAVIDGGAPMLIAKGDVGATPHTALTIALPASAGQACFERASGDKIHCLRWGTIANPVGTLAASGPAPADGQSLQICGGTTAPAAPTPRAANSCAASQPPSQSPPPPSPSSRDRTRPVARVAIPRQSFAAARARGLKVRVRSNEAGRVRARLLRRGRVVSSLTRALRANRTRTLSLRLPRGTTARVYRVSLRIADQAGNARSLSRAVTLRR